MKKFATASDAPAAAVVFNPPRRALLCRFAARDGLDWSDSAGVRGVLVHAMDGRGDAAEHALVSIRSGSVTDRVWVPVADLASTPKAAAEKLAPLLSAVFAATQRLQEPAPKAVADTAEIPGWEKWAGGKAA